MVPVPRARAGHARLIFERFGRRWGTFALADLVAVNLLVLVTEFIGIALGLGYFGVSRYLSVPIAAAALVAASGTGSFRHWERAMYALVAASLVAVPLLAVVRPHGATLLRVAAARPGSSPGSVLVVVALIGTTVAPWQLFFQQSNVVDKRITARWISYERADTAIGTALFALGAVAVMSACAVAFSGTALHGAFAYAGEVAGALHARGGAWAGALFAVVLVNGSVLGAGAVTLATSYAIGDVTGTRHSLHRGWGDARTFHRSYAAFIAAAAVIVLIPSAPLGIVTIGVQALAGVLLPSALVFLLLLCNDRAVLGPWVNPRWLNTAAASVVGVLLALSALLTAVTLFPGLSVRWPAAVAAGALEAGLGALAGTRLGSEPGTAGPDGTVSGRPTWTMPPIETLPPPARARTRNAGLLVLRAYLLLAAAAVAVRIVQLIAGSLRHRLSPPASSPAPDAGPTSRSLVLLRREDGLICIANAVNGAVGDLVHDALQLGADGAEFLELPGGRLGDHDLGGGEDFPAADRDLAGGAQRRAAANDTACTRDRRRRSRRGH